MFENLRKSANEAVKARAIFSSELEKLDGKISQAEKKVKVAEIELGKFCLLDQLEDWDSEIETLRLQSMGYFQSAINNWNGMGGLGRVLSVFLIPTVGELRFEHLLPWLNKEKLIEGMKGLVEENIENGKISSSRVTTVRRSQRLEAVETARAEVKKLTEIRAEISG